MQALTKSNDPNLLSWVESANVPGIDFPIQNLPYGRFRLADDDDWRIGVAIGEMVLDLRETGLINHSDMSKFLSISREQRIQLRIALSAGLAYGSANSSFKKAIHSLTSVQLGMPCDIGDYTDFYVGIHHATSVGKLFRPDNPLLPNYKWLPIAYHGRSSSIDISDVSFHRPKGQIRELNQNKPELSPSARLDFELELGVVIGQGNHRGCSIGINQAEDHVFGLTLLNDWSARDFQAWEYQPLGPFLSKNFATTISPWIVSMEALEPFRCQLNRPIDDAQPLPYLVSEENTLRGAFDINLEVLIQTPFMRASNLPFERISYSNFSEAAYWTIAQMLTHHTVNGCKLRPGDLFGSGTLSGPNPDQAGSLLELTNGGNSPVRLSNGEVRTFLQDGDSIALKAWCEKDGCRRIGFGPCVATVLPIIN